jgi:phosphomannomutase
LTLDFGDWWLNLRPSNTEPLLRVNLESPDEASCKEHLSKVLEIVKGS